MGLLTAQIAQEGVGFTHSYPLPFLSEKRAGLQAGEGGLQQPAPRPLPRPQHQSGEEPEPQPCSCRPGSHGLCLPGQSAGLPRATLGLGSLAPSALGFGATIPWLEKQVQGAGQASLRGLLRLSPEGAVLGQDSLSHQQAGCL